MSRAVRFEIHASNPELSIAFYRKLFGWSFNKWQAGAYWAISTGPDEQPGINGGLLQRGGPSPDADSPVNAFVVTVDVDDLDAALTRAQEGAGSDGASRGVVCMPKTAIPGIGWLAYIRDPDGNVLGMMQTDPNAG